MTLENLIDLTSYERLFHYVFDDENIDQLFEVDSSLDLGVVAYKFSIGDVEYFNNVMMNGLVRMETNVPMNMAVNCIRLEPIYLYQHTGKKYE